MRGVSTRPHGRVRETVLVLQALCLTCLVYKRFSDLEQVRQERLYSGTNYLTRITLSEDGAIFADITYGGYAIICLGLLIGHLTSGLVSAPMVSARPLFPKVGFRWKNVYDGRGRGGSMARALASHQGKPCSIPDGAAPGFSQVGIVPYDAADRRVFSGSCVSPLFFAVEILHSTRCVKTEVDNNENKDSSLTSDNRKAASVLRSEGEVMRVWSSAGMKGRGPRKPADQRHYSARFPHAKIRDVTGNRTPVRLGFDRTVKRGAHNVIDERTTSDMRHCRTELVTKEKNENFLLGLGVVMFAIAGSVVFVSLETALPDLKEYSAVLGTLSLVTALLMILDLLTGSRRRKEYRARAKAGAKPAWFPTKATQTDVGQIVYEATKSVDLLGPAHRLSNGHVPAHDDGSALHKPANGRSAPYKAGVTITRRTR
ncbi:hypothetical protein PR048_003009 [Dryococelus australis]|uniref:Transmembrane protein n=1 Tax=Dryococelus australis TaxID=614101 RepID=A0ABQ9ILT2_9NEOP|nr:hypothetical protein PR048_003009 [Dryococelus australis]